MNSYIGSTLPGQIRYDLALPDDAPEIELHDDADALMKADDSEYVSFYAWADEFAVDAMNRVEENDDEHQKLQMILALLRGDTELAAKMAERYRQPLLDSAYEAAGKAYDRMECAA